MFYHQLHPPERGPAEVDGLPQGKENALRLTDELIELVIPKEKAA